VTDSIAPVSDKSNQQQIPWRISALVVLLFFVAEHNFSLSAEGDFGRGTAESIGELATHGNSARRLAFIILCGIGLFQMSGRDANRPTIRGPVGWIAAMLFLWAMASVAWAPDGGLAMRRAAVLVMLSLGAMGIASRLSARQMIWMIFAVTGSFLLIGLAAELALGTFTPWKPGYRFAGTVHPNLQGTYGMLAVLSSFGLALQTTGKRKSFAICTLLAFALLFLTGSRTAFACAVAGCLATTLWASSRSPGMRTAIYAAMTLSPLLLLFQWFAPTLEEAVRMGRDDQQMTAGAFNGRAQIWDICLGYAAQRPLFGYGYRAFWTPDHITDISEAVEWGLQSAHNAFLDIALELGIIGLAGSVALLVAALHSVLAQAKTPLEPCTHVFAALLLICALHALFESILLAQGAISFFGLMVVAKLGCLQPARATAQRITDYPLLTLGNGSPA
jgi:exopolysaccharide production protein ExoQ